MGAAVSPRRLATVLGAALTTALVAATASAAPAAADFLVFVAAGPRPTLPAPLVRNGATTEVTGLSFKAGIWIDHNGGEAASARVRMQLPTGLRWGPDEPDPTERCTGSATTAECQTALLDAAIPAQRTENWTWDVVAGEPGSYVLRVEIVETSAPDSDPSSNVATATIVVRAPAGGTGPATVSASAVRVSPAKPRAGSAVTAAVRVTAGGAPVRPVRVTCTGKVGRAALKGTARARSGSATCVYRPPQAAKGKTLRGNVSFTARGTRFTRRFATRLG